MNADALCMGCMCERGVADACARCHYLKGTPAESFMVLPPGTVLKSNYVVGKKLGQGGFGITYIGYDFTSNRRLAIKEYFPREISTRSDDHHTVSPLSRANRDDLDYGLLKFEEEAHALAQFKDHPSIVSFLDFFRANGTGYIVMGYVDGDTLRKHLRQHGERISFDEALQILNQVMKALEEIHRVNILHRDISPENIYIESDGNVVLLDFGAAKQALGEQSQSLSVILRPGYAPEEQYRRKGRQGPWTDIYALGATFYRSITGKIPSESPDRLHHDDLVPPRRLGVSISAKSEQALLKALAIKAENRFQTAPEFRNAITPRGFVYKPTSGTREPDFDKVARPSGRLSRPLLLSFLVVIFTTMFAVSVAGGNYLGAEVFPFLALFGLMLFVLQRMWKSIQDGHARTAPDKAMALCFIPVLNLYWAFPVMWGFSVDYNRYLSRHQLGGRKLPEALFLVTTVAYVLTCVFAPFSLAIPDANWFFSFLVIVNAVLLCSVVAKACDAVNALGTPSLTTTPGKILDLDAARNFSIYCIVGQYEGQQLPVGQRPIVIGRNPSRSNLVIASDDISSAHVKVWLNESDNGIWIEDLNSTNGTFYRKATSDDSSSWIQLSGSRLLSPGDRFQLSQGKAAFEVRQS